LCPSIAGLKQAYRRYISKSILCQFCILLSGRYTFNMWASKSIKNTFASKSIWAINHWRIVIHFAWSENFLRESSNIWKAYGGGQWTSQNQTSTLFKLSKTVVCYAVLFRETFHHLSYCTGVPNNFSSLPNPADHMSVC
jgi:nuclear transport factor 2 (NTF2) superfamily protein